MSCSTADIILRLDALEIEAPMTKSILRHDGEGYGGTPDYAGSVGELLTALEQMKVENEQLTELCRLDSQRAARAEAALAAERAKSERRLRDPKRGEWKRKYFQARANLDDERERAEKAEAALAAERYEVDICHAELTVFRSDATHDDLVGRLVNAEAALAAERGGTRLYFVPDDGYGPHVPVSAEWDGERPGGVGSGRSLPGEQLVAEYCKCRAELERKDQIIKLAWALTLTAPSEEEERRGQILDTMNLCALALSLLPGGEHE